MTYKFNSNVNKTGHSPVNVGIHTNLSGWQEVPYTQFATLGTKERQDLINRLSEENEQVHVKTACTKGHARIWVR